jgi:HD-GYP domain-containing protein (c-di-GMP phosphodiesterase class II)
VEKTIEIRKTGRDDQKSIIINRYIIHNNQINVRGFSEFLKIENATLVHFEDRRDLQTEDTTILQFILVVLDDDYLISHLTEIVDWIKFESSVYTQLIIDEKNKNIETISQAIPHENICTILSSEKHENFYLRNLSNAFNQLYARMETFKIRTVLAHKNKEIEQLIKIGVALSTERNHNQLLKLILEKARQITRSDSGSIYLVERKDPTKLRFKQSSLNLDAGEFVLPIDKKSLAGYVALTGTPLNIPNTYEIPEDAEYKFNKNYDREHNYITRSMLVIPMKNHKNKVVGVLQLINRKKKYYLEFSKDNMDNILPYTTESMELAMAVAGQATVAIENNLLLQDIQEIFESFIKASALAIESRDPTTSGHSFRVATITTELARLATLKKGGIFNHINFSSTQIKELEYAAILHDFGKIGVREEVLTKAKKLYPHGLEIIKWRFGYIKKTLEANLYKTRQQYLLKHGNKNYEEFFEFTWNRYQSELKRINELYESVEEANEPRILAGGMFDKISRMAKIHFQGPDDTDMPLLTQEEISFLTIPKGTLDEKERQEIESHVLHTFKFLQQIPWTDELSNLPHIAAGHHEKLNGSGYPNGLTEKDILPQTRMMTIADIYDALTSMDRPYKKGVPVKIALKILHEEVTASAIDKELINLFIDAKVFEIVEHKLEY